MAFFMRSALALVSVAGLAQAATVTSSAVSTLATASATSGTVVLPYATYAATLNASYSLYTYKNIRFADPPTGDLRMLNPVAPTTVNTTIQDGSYGQTCYQLEQGPNSGALNQGEDCLFMDVVVPENIPSGTLLPVMLYLFGGGYHSGQKEIYDGSPLVTASNNSMIYVVPNYRLGAFGFFGELGDVMPGLMDQVLAMEWVQSYIHLFGGDASEVTVAGHSAGGGSLMTHLVANGGEGTLPFKRAIVMSPAVPPNSAAEYITERNAGILDYFGYDNYTRADIIALPATSINDLTAHYGASGWGPIVDGDYFRELPGYAMAAGRYHSDMPILSGKLSDEAHNYIPTTSPYIINGDSNIRNMTYDTEAQMIDFFTTMGFHLNSSVIDEAWNLYPTINNTDMYYTIFGKYDHIYTEALFSCNSYYLETAYTSVNGWYFDIWPGYHAQENPYLFVGGSGSGATSQYTINSTVSTFMKSYVVNFVMSADVNAGGIAPEWDLYSVAQQNIELGSTNVGMIADPMTNDRCVWWQSHMA
ncbi:hypothetical protein BP5796_11396 [Coleophoma crateriformis]|uniref:Carboxylic ester hydrolase n=1 Tax=Coleophoma crateriformis TaxID=565419 RepID=A0A3D8QJ96_9HELO|nr:hypothetical protein BP5796_11396 [Coleophoma crateriformis]